MRVGLVFLSSAVLALRLSAQPIEDVEQREKAIDGLRKYGAKIVFDNKRTGRPVIRVEMNGPQVTDDAIQHLRPFFQLQSLHLCQTKISDKGLESIQHMKNLQVLYLTYSKVSAKGAEYLIGLEKLDTLGLSYTDVTDLATPFIASLKGLKTLALSQTAITDAGVKNLQKLQNLQHLYLDGTLITPAGLAHVKALPLETLSYSDTRAAKDGEEGFVKKKP